nr:hypothetical protein CFP56_34888 [Quercus suber]
MSDVGEQRVGRCRGGGGGDAGTYNPGARTQTSIITTTPEENQSWPLARAQNHRSRLQQSHRCMAIRHGGLELIVTAAGSALYNYQVAPEQQNSGFICLHCWGQLVRCDRSMSLNIPKVLEPAVDIDTEARSVLEFRSRCELKSWQPRPSPVTLASSYVVSALPPLACDPRTAGHHHQGTMLIHSFHPNRTHSILSVDGLRPC